MKELQHKQKVKRRMYSMPVLIGLFILLVILGKGVIGVLEKERTSREHVKDLEEKALALTMRSQELEGDIKSLDTEEGVMRELKQKYNVVEEGEMVVVVVEDVRSATTTSEAEEGWISGFWTNIRGLFGRDK